MRLLDYIHECGLTVLATDAPVEDLTAWDHHLAASFNRRYSVADCVAGWCKRYSPAVLALALTPDLPAA